MSKQSKRRQRAKTIYAAASGEKVIQLEAVAVDWIKAADEGDDGAGAPKRFTMTAYTGGPMLLGMFDEPVVVDLSSLKATAPLPILMNHDTEKLVGHADSVDIGASSLKLSGVISGAGSHAEQVVASAAAGFPWKASIGARPGKMEFISEGVSTKVNGKNIKGPVFVARNSKLGEVSFVPIAADDKTTAKLAARAVTNRKEPEMEKFHKWLKAMEFDPDSLTDAQRTSLQAKYDVEVKAAADADIKTKAKVKAEADAKNIKAEGSKFDLAATVLTYEKHVASVQAESAKYAKTIKADKLVEIQATASTKALELKAQALNEEKESTWLELELLKAQADVSVALVRAEAPTARPVYGSSTDAKPEVIEAALCRSSGLPDIEKRFKPEVLEAADKIRGYGLQEMLLAGAAEGGYTGRQKIHGGNLREVLQAAFSTHSVTTALTQLGHKNLLAGFDVVPQTWKEVAVSDTVPDFKTTTAFRLTASLEYEELGPGGEIKHGELGQESYTKKAKTYAKMLALTRNDIINDDLGMFNDIRNRLGMGAAIKVNKEFWTVWLAAANAGVFWAAGRGNLVTSASFNTAGLTKAVKAFRTIGGTDGGLMNLNPDRVLVPPELETTALEFFTSREQRDTTATTKAGTNNIFNNRFRPVVVPELSNSSFTGYSATDWWMLPNPAILASASVVFLNGVQTPVIESADVDFNVLGIQFRGYHDFGVQMTEHRATVAAQA